MIDPETLLPAKLLEDISAAQHYTHKEAEDAIAQIICDIQNAKLTPEQFVALSKYKKKYVRNCNGKTVEKDNIFHLIVKHSRLPLDLFKSTSEPLNQSQVLEILTETGDSGKNIYSYLRVGHLLRDIWYIQHIINAFDLPKAPLKKMLIDSEKSKELFTYYCKENCFNPSENINEIILHKFNAHEFIEALTTDSERSYKALLEIKDDTALADVVRVFNDFKPSPEEYSYLFKQLCNRAVLSAFESNAPDFEFFIRALSTYCDGATNNPNQFFEKEKELLNDVREVISHHSQIPSYSTYTPGIDAIAQSRENRLLEKRVVRAIARPIALNITPLQPAQRPLKKGALC
jgi:hypothetical protein